MSSKWTAAPDDYGQIDFAAMFCVVARELGGHLEDYRRQAIVKGLANRMKRASCRSTDLLSARDPPDGGSFDLVVCRNVLIYFDLRVHARVLELLTASLAPGGYLCLGEAGQLPLSYAGSFDTVRNRDRIYHKR